MGALFLVNEEGSQSLNTEYLTGFTGTTSQLLITHGGGRYLCVDGRYHERAAKEIFAGVHLIKISQRLTLPMALQDLVRQRKIAKITCDSSVTTVASFEQLKKLFPKVIIKSTPKLFQRLRIIKSDEEIAAIRKASIITVRALSHIKKSLRSGLSEKEIAARLERKFLEFGAHGVAFPSIVASGSHGSSPHAVPSNRKIRAGEYVTIDCGAIYRGYATDMTRTFLVPGRLPSMKIAQVYKAVEEAQQAGIRAVRPGIKASEVDEICRRVLDEHGLLKYFIHGTGHGVGREVHELPIISSHSKTILEPGMVITVEPGVYIPKIGGVRIEDTLLVTKKGAEVLTQFS